MQPKVTIAIPVYNGGEYFELALKSALAQTYKNIEIIVVNDGSVDGGKTDAIAKTYLPRIKYIHQVNKGVGGALNTAILNMTGDIFTWLSHDDIYLAEKTEAQVGFYGKAGRRDAILFADYHLIDAEGNHIVEVKLDHQQFVKTPMLPLLNGCINGCTIFVPIHIMREAGPFDPQQRFTQDYDLWNKILRRYEFFHQARTLIRYRIHPGQDTQAEKPGVAIEGDKLWTRMVDDRSEVERVHLFGSAKRYFLSLADFLDKTPHKHAALHAHARAERAIEEARVSVVIPFFNEIPHVLEAVRSVLRQTHNNLQIILVDDGSTDDTRPVQALVQSDERISLSRQSKSGRASARNRGMNESTGDYIAFLDANDQFAPDKIRHQLTAMQDAGSLISHTSYEVTFPERFGGKGIINSGVFSGQMYPEILSNCPVATPTVMMHSSLISAGFAFPTESHEGEDVLAWTWATQRYRILGIDKPLSIVEWSSNSTALNVRRSLRGLRFQLNSFRADPIHRRHHANLRKLEGMISHLEAMRDRVLAERGDAAEITNDGMIVNVFKRDTDIVDRRGQHSLDNGSPKILFVCFPYSVHAAGWISLLNEAKWNCHVFPAQPTNALHDNFRSVTFWPAPGVPIPEYVGLERRNDVQVSWHLEGTPCLPGYLARVIEQERFDIVHTMEFQHAGYLMLAALDRLKGPAPRWIATNYGADIVLYGSQPEHEGIIGQLLARCDYYTSECHRDVKLARHLGFTGQVLMVAPNCGGIDLMATASMRVPGKTSARRVIVIKGYQHFAGRALTALEALELCPADLTQYEVKIFAPGPGVQAEAQRIAHARHLKITCLPEIAPHHDILKLHGSARASIAISSADGISTSLLEAMAMGSFPIQTSTACADEWIKDGVSGFIVEPDDPSTVAKRLATVLEDDELVDRAAELNLLKIQTMANRASMQERVQAIYDKVMSR